MTKIELQRAIDAWAAHFTKCDVALSDGRMVHGTHPRIATEQNMEAVGTGWDPERLVMDIPADPSSIYLIRIGNVVGVSIS